VCDVLYTMDTEAVSAMVTKAMHDRKRKLEESQDLLVDMRPEFAAAFKRC
jgi:DNA-binding protein YbaB